MAQKRGSIPPPPVYTDKDFERKMAEWEKNYIDWVETSEGRAGMSEQRSRARSRETQKEIMRLRALNNELERLRLERFERQGVGPLRLRKMYPSAR